MFLTGFDSKRLNTLYVDKSLKYHGLIQAFSRTNRILDERKSQGNIVCFRNIKKARDDAIALFSKEEAKDIISMERAGRYRGLYHVLNGVISPSEGVGPEDIKLKELLQRCKNEAVKELIIATDLDNEGETTARYISRLLEDTDIVVTRIAHGIPAGGNIEYADEITIMKAIEGRRKI